ncbi:MAG: PAS domain-containing protein, partial [Chloroflexota bacterium]|nr:PAS domain-containing protein [Chloroflexota bacterium]
LQSYLRGETPVFELEHRLQHKDGSYRWILSRGASVHDASGKLYRMAGSHTDITERRKAEDELRRSEANLAASQRIAHLGSWEWDVIANQEHWSDEVYRIFGYTPQQFTPTYDIFLNCLHPDDRAVVIQAVEDALDNKHPYHVEHRIVRPDGTERTVLEQAEVVFDEGGSRVRMIGTVQDITERKRAEEQHNELLAQVERALEIRNQFLSIASHELKTPVTLLKGYAQLIEEKARQRNDTGYQKPIATINRQVDRMTQLINDLLDVSRIESGKVEFDMQPFDLNLAVEEIVHEIEATMPGLKLELEQQAEGVWVYGDRIRIQQVITNLVTNAVKYSDKSKDVNVCVQREAAKALVTVTDRGIGIPNQQQAQVFNLYFRGANASANNYGGLGLGLYISKTILDRHGGEIGLHSEEGVGSTFYFSLPIHASTHPPAQADRDLAASL